MPDMRRRTFLHAETYPFTDTDRHTVLELAARPEGCALTDVMNAGYPRSRGQALLGQLEDDGRLRGTYDPIARRKTYHAR